MQPNLARRPEPPQASLDPQLPPGLAAGRADGDLGLQYHPPSWGLLGAPSLSEPQFSTESGYQPHGASRDCPRPPSL